MYCCICGAPACWAPCIQEGDRDGPGERFEAIAGVTRDDVDWIYYNSVAVFADFISPPGTHNGYGAIEVSSGEKHDMNGRPLSDPVTVPSWVQENRAASGRYWVSIMESGSNTPLAHQTCIYLAAEWSKVESPARFSPDGPTDPSKFFWDSIGPVLHFLCQSEVSDASPATLTYHAKSQANMEALGNPLQLDMEAFYNKSEFKYGYEPESPEAEWLTGIDHRSKNFRHEKKFGFIHLKRPDHFPDIHQITGTVQVDGFFFHKHIPLEIILQIINDGELNGPDIRALECLSRSWRDFFRTPLMQIDCWKARVIEWKFVPTAADWTRSAEAVRQALAVPRAEVLTTDWRRYYNDARKSPNLSNRARIAQSALQLNHGMKNCKCAEEAVEAHKKEMETNAKEEEDTEELKVELTTGIELGLMVV